MSARLRLLRHGHAVAATSHNDDPALSALGERQAQDAVAHFHREPPARLVSSPLRRARDTAAPLAAQFRLEVTIEPAYAELPWRDGQTPLDRACELQGAAAWSWPDLDAARRRWHDRLIEHALAEVGDVVIVTHFFVINALVGFAFDTPRTLVTRPAPASVTEFALSGRRLQLIALGQNDAGVVPA